MKLVPKDSEWKKIKTDAMLLGIPNKDDILKTVANYRGIGLSDMINSIKENLHPRCSLNLALHVLEIMEGILLSSKNSNIYRTTTQCNKPKALKEKEILLLKA